MYQSGLKLLKAFNLFSGKCLVRSSAPMTTIYKRQLSSSHSKSKRSVRFINTNCNVQIARFVKVNKLCFQFRHLRGHCHFRVI